MEWGEAVVIDGGPEWSVLVKVSGSYVVSSQLRAVGSSPKGRNDCAAVCSLSAPFAVEGRPSSSLPRGYAGRGLRKEVNGSWRLFVSSLA